MCFSGGGVSRSLLLIVSVGVLSTASGLWSINSPMLSILRPSNMVSTGSASVTIFGAFFPAFDCTISIRSVVTACESSDWSSSSALRCRASLSTLRTRVSAFTVGRQVGCHTSAFSIYSPSISSRTFQNLASTGAILATFHGSGLGLSSRTASQRFGSTTVTRSIWLSDTGISGRAGYGLRHSRSVLVSVGQVSSTSTSLFSFLQCMLSIISVTNSAPTGTVSLTLTGAQMGMAAASSSARAAISSCETSQWKSDTAVRCLAVSSISQSRRVVITSGCLLSSTTQSFSFNALQLSAAGMYSNSFPFVPQMLTLYGLAFGIFDNSPLARVGLTACESSKWTSQSSLLCRISSGMATNDHITVTVGMVHSTISRVLIYDSPVISSAFAQNCAPSDPIQTTVFGLNFGKASLSNKLRIGGTPCDISLWISDTAMLCKPGSSYARPKWHLPIVLSLGNAAGFSPSDYSFSLTQVLVSYKSVSANCENSDKFGLAGIYI